MTDKPVLAVLREILRFKGSATPAEIARLAKLQPLYVLRVLNANEKLLKRSKGKIVQENARLTWLAQQWNAGAYFVARDFSDDEDVRKRLGGYLEFMGHSDFRKAAEKTIMRTYGKETVVPDTPENRAALVERGCHPWHSISSNDDRLWQEPLSDA